MPVDECLYPALRHDLRLLTQVARAARKRREQAGAVELSAGGELKFNFKHDSKVKHLWVDARTREHLSGGTLAVVESKADGKYVIVPVDVAHKIQERSAEHFVAIANPKQLTKLELEEQAYADFAIPDDLDW